MAGGGGIGGTQIIGGNSYGIYTPAWYAAMRQNESDVAGAAGKAAGAFASNALGGIPSLGGLANPTGSATGAFGGSVSGSASGTGTGTGGSVTSGSSIAPLTMPDMTASNNATFAAAKDKVGQQSRASLDALNGELGSKGMLGSGAEVQGVRDVVNNNAEQLGQVTRDSAKANAATALDLAKTNYTGSIAQRGQDIQSQEANASLALQANNQRFQALSLALQALGGARSGSASISGQLY